MPTLPIGEERVSIDKEVRERERVRVRTEVATHIELVTADLHSEDVIVDRVPIDQEIDELPELRHEGNVLIVPVVEEQLVVTKRLVLKEELHITRRVRTEQVHRAVSVRRLKPIVEREELGKPIQDRRRRTMDRTITALYDTREHAEAAKQQIEDRLGMGKAHVDIMSQGSAGGTSTHESEGLMERLKEFFMGEEDRHTYSEGIRRGGYLLSARVDESRADEVCALLDSSGAVDLDTRQQEWASSGWNREQTATRSNQGSQVQRLGRDDTGSERIPLAEERLKVGKREVERGSVRVRSFVEENPVHEQIDLREEHVDVERKPVDRTLSGADADRLFQERTIEMTERAEEPVIAKDAVVTEEVGLRKETDRHTETIDDTVRKTRVDVDDGRREARQDRRRESLAGEPERSFASPEDHSVAMDPDGLSARETEEERERRLRDNPGGRPIPL